MLSTDLTLTQHVLLYIGVAALSYFLLRIGILLYAHLQPSNLPRFLHKDQESWAIVTGASDGIGFGFCQELAKHGFNVVLHGRNKKKLQDVSERLVEEFPTIQTRIFVADATKPVSYDNLLNVVKDVNLTVLVNNVGGNKNLPSPYTHFQDRKAEDIDGTINLNLGFTTKITNVLLPTLIENEPSLVLNIGSFAALGIPKLNVYSGTKGFLMTFTESLHGELAMQGRDVTVQYVFVGSVQSDENKVEPGLFVPTSREMARAALRQVGGAVVVTPYLPHAVQKFFLSCLPSWLKVPLLISATRDSEARFAKWE